MKALVAICTLSHCRNRKQQRRTQFQSDFAIPNARTVSISRARVAEVTPLLQNLAHTDNPLHWIFMHEM